MCQTPSTQEIESQIERLRNCELLGKDGVRRDLLGCSAQLMIKNIYKLIKIVLENESIPNNWNVVLICPIYRKYDKK